VALGQKSLETPEIDNWCNTLLTDLEIRKFCYDVSKSAYLVSHWCNSFKVKKQIFKVIFLVTWCHCVEVTDALCVKITRY